MVCSSKASSKFYKSVLHQNNPLSALNDIPNQFVVPSIDKANGNVALICQPFYPLVLIKELGLDHNNTDTNKTYIPVHKTNNQVISGHIRVLRKKFNSVVDEENKKLPNICWTLKLHKHPSKARFIIAARQCHVKPFMLKLLLQY